MGRQRGTNQKRSRAWFRYRATFGFIAIFFIIYLIEFVLGAPGDYVQLYRLGAWSPMGISLFGEWQRFLVSPFLHFNLFHLVLDTTLVFLVGRVLEPKVGGPRLILLFFSTVLLLDWILLHLADGLMLQDGISMGASPALLALFVSTYVPWRMMRTRMHRKAYSLNIIPGVVTAIGCIVLEYAVPGPQALALGIGVLLVPFLLQISLLTIPKALKNSAMNIRSV